MAFLDEEEKAKVLVNTFDALEPEALKAIENYNVIAIGPLTPSAFLDGKDPSDTSFGGDLFQKSKDYKEWLDSKDAASVIYVSFGSVLALPKKQMEEIASGLLKTGRPFLWVIRAKDDGTEEHEEDKLCCIEELEKKGMIVPWCSQLEVLTHPSVGCFLTHCGWNSTLESIVSGVPVVAFPYWTDQGTNAKLVEDVWRTGVRVTPNEEGTVERDEALDFKEWESKAEYEYVKHNGVSIFLMESGMLGTLGALWDVFPLFTNTGWGENSNIGFLKKHMGASFEQRPQPWVTNISVDDIHSGDFLALSKIRGRWGGFETLEKWVSGAYAGHSAVCLRDSEGKLWVGESGHEDEEGRDIIAILPWDEWWDFELTKDDANPHIALLPLRPDIRAKFNETAAWEYARSMSGKPYGYHNLIFSWIDTIDENYPPPLDAHLIASVMTVWSQLQPSYAANMWNEALNKRLGTEGFGLSDVLVEVERRGSSFAHLLTIPERDDWVYSDGKSTSCVAFVLEMYKEAGIFGDVGSSIEVTEFTIKDAYSLNFFENDTSRLPQWCNDGDTVKLPYCQIKGKYRMELPGYNSMDPYAHMNERCPSMPPEYSRTENC